MCNTISLHQELMRSQYLIDQSVEILKNLYESEQATRKRIDQSRYQIRASMHLLELREHRERQDAKRARRKAQEESAQEVWLVKV